MNPETRERLLKLNRDFYATVAAPFHETRKAWSPGKARLLTLMPDTGECPLRVLDVGCGNGRFAVMLDTLARPVRYVGVDGDGALLAHAAEHTAGLKTVRADFVQADLADREWLCALPLSDDRGYDVVLCLATLQHVPGEDLRRRVVADLAACAAAGGTVIVSAWQFLSSPRFVERLIPWSEIGVDQAAVEPGDALLPWKQELYAIRYVHQIDADEMRRLATAAELVIVEQFNADGKEGNLNQYTLMRLDPE